MGLSAAYNPDKDIPDLSGKVILVTGGEQVQSQLFSQLN
jgi:hypothetical protein